MKKEDAQVLREINALWDDYNLFENFEFLAEDDFENLILPYLRETTAVSKDKKLKRNYSRNRSDPTINDIYSLDTYYVGLINDTLLAIRDGYTAYIFNLEQVREILRFEPEANISLHDGIYYVNLPLTCKY